MSEEQIADAIGTSDAELVLRTRDGDTEAFAELFSRHYSSGMTVARGVTTKLDPDDLVQEAYARILQAIQRGKGPSGSFRAYLFASIRNTAASWGRASHETAIDELDTIPDPDSTDPAIDEAFDRSLTTQAFRSLPSRWQEVLWYTEVEQMKPAAVGKLLGMSAGAVSQLAFRAREGLREAWIQAHLNSTAEGSECRWAIDSLGGYSRGNLGKRDKKRMELHLHDCARCLIVAAEAKEVSGRLAVILLPLVLGVGGASAYLSSLQGGGTPIVALAAGTETLVGAPGTAGGGAGAGGAGASGAGAAGAAGSSALGGVGLLIGAGALAVVAAGAAVALVLPGLFAPSAGPDGSAQLPPGTIVPIEPDPDAGVLPLVPDEGDDEPEQTEPDDKGDPGDDGPRDDGDDGGDEGDDGPGDEGDDGDEEEPPVVPHQPLAVSAASVTCEIIIDEDDNVFTRTHYWVSVLGEPGWTVQARLDSDAPIEATLDGAGSATIVLQPWFAQVYLNAPVTFHYLHEGTVVGDSTVVALHALADPIGSACGSDDDDPAPVPEVPLALVFEPPIVLSCHVVMNDPEPDLYVNYFSISITGTPGFGVMTFIGSDVAGAVRTVIDASGSAVVTVHPTTAEIAGGVPLTFHYDLSHPADPSAITFPLFDTGTPGSDACP